jgi:hypothetical protein
LDKNECSHGENLEEWMEVKNHGEIPPNQRDLRGRRVGGERDRRGRSGSRRKNGRWGSRVGLTAGGPTT